MKQLPLVLSVVAFLISAVFGTLFLTNNCSKDSSKENVAAIDSLTCNTGAGSIVYIDLDVLLQDYDMANDLRSVVETKVQNIQAEVDRKGKKLESEVKSFQEKVSKGLMTRSVAEIQGQKLQQQELEFNNYAQTKQQEIMEEQQVMMNQIADAIKTFIDKYNEEKKYDMIITNQVGAPIITANPALNITADVLAGLNEEYIATKNKK